MRPIRPCPDEVRIHVKLKHDLCLTNLVDNETTLYHGVQLSLQQLLFVLRKGYTLD